jgi:hypothetical protein
MTDKQVSASFLPSVPNGETVKALAGLKRLTVCMGVSELGTSGPYIDVNEGDDNVPAQRKSVLVRVADTNYDGVDVADTRYINHSSS